jgi:GAF domain-containing protein
MTGEPGESRTPRPGFSVPEGPNALRLQQIARVSAELGAAESMQAVIDAAVTHAATAIGASVSTLMLTEGDQLHLLAGTGLRPGVAEEWSRFGLDDENPASVAARTGRPVVLGNPDQVEREYPVLRGYMPAGRSLVCLPLDSVPPSVGVIGLTFEAGWLPGPTEMHFLTTYADACGQAVRRLQASAQAELRARHLTFLARVSEELASSLDYRETLRNVAALAVPELADWCAVQVVQDGALTTLAVAHSDPAKVRWAEELQKKYPPDIDAPTGAAAVIRTGVGEVHPYISDEMLVAGARDEEHLALSRELDLRSAVIVPLSAGGRSFGALTLLRTGAAPPYDEGDLLFAEDVGRRAGIAVENARLYEQTQDVALQLQHALLPDAVPRLPGWDLAAHYAPGGRGGVGGDFYDAVALPNDMVAVVIGDVMGHGVSAAAAMAQMRAAVRAFISLDPAPAKLAANLDTMFARLEITQLVTLVYGIADPNSGQFCFVNAGHYPPLLISPDGRPRMVHSTPRLPFGAGGDERSETVIDFQAAHVLLLYTDGLVEHRGEIVDVGMDRLVRAAPRLSSGPLTARLAALTNELVGADTADDDVTAFAVRRTRRD